MLPRVLEPEVMDSEEEAQAYDTMDHTAVNEAFARDFLALWKGQNPILDVGTGTAQIPVTLCRLDPRPQIVAVDLATAMLRQAAANIQRAGLTGRIRLFVADVKTLGQTLAAGDIPAAGGTFPAVLSNSLIHHLPQPELALAELWRVTSPGGLLFVRDLLRPESSARLEELVALYAGTATAYQQALFRASLQAALTLEEVRYLVSQLGLSPAQVQQTSDRHWTLTAWK
jgi:ubiquinone/menaquinone biosynthesis C-methylase UbiE